VPVIPQRELRNSVAEVLRRADASDDFTITVAAIAALLFVLGLALLVAPDTVPGLMVPRDGGATVDGGTPIQ
jgi:hypothetical protein